MIVLITRQKDTDEQLMLADALVSSVDRLQVRSRIFQPSDSVAPVSGLAKLKTGKALEQRYSARALKKISPVRASAIGADHLRVALELYKQVVCGVVRRAMC